MEMFWENFFSNFTANILSDALLAIALFFIVTQPGEKKKKDIATEKSLGLLKAEAQVNFNRADAYSKALIKPSDELVTLFPLRYSRGAWNALKETDFFSNLHDPHLIYYLFRMNEATFVANRNLRKLQLALLDKKQKNLGFLVETAQKESEHVLNVLGNVVQMMDDIKLPEFAIEDPFEPELEKTNEKEDRNGSGI